MSRIVAGCLGALGILSEQESLIAAIDAMPR
jgi:hypothetical protein